MTVGVVPDGAGPRYPQLLRTPRHRWWRPPLGLLLASMVVVLLSVGVILAAVAVEVLQGGSASPRDSSLDADTPLGLLANNLVIATLIPGAVLAVLVVHRQSPRLLLSVVGRLRRPAFVRLLGVATAVVVVFFVASFAVPPVGVGDVDAPDAATLVGLFAVILLTTPLQSAAEETWFRGYLSQAVGSWYARPLTGAVVAGGVSAVLFALAHGGQEPALFGDRFAFGVVASWLVWRTGGLEASIALHVANNVVSLGWTAATGSIEDSLESSTLDWPYAALDITMMVVYALLVVRLSGRWGLSPRRPAALSGSDAVGYPDPRSPGPPPAGQEPPWGMG